MSFDRESFIDIVRLSQSTGKVPKEIPAHYWRFCWSLRRKAMGNKVPNVDIWSNLTRSKPIRLGYN